MYEVSILIRNLTKKMKRVKIKQPLSSKFRCDYDLKGPLAPGLTLELFLSFFSTKVDNFFDELTIISDDTEIKIPLNAYQPVADLKFPTFINFGFTSIKSTLHRTIQVENIGNMEGKIELQNDHSAIKIEPNN